MIDAERQDDLFDALLYEIMNRAVVSEGLARELAEVAERHADRRTTEILRIIAQPIQTDYPDVAAYLNRIADRVDPDVNTENEVPS